LTTWTSSWVGLTTSAFPTSGTVTVTLELPALVWGKALLDLPLEVTGRDKHTERLRLDAADEFVRAIIREARDEALYRHLRELRAMARRQDPKQFLAAGVSLMDML
jgi:hypothetical protein